MLQSIFKNSFIITLILISIQFSSAQDNKFSAEKNKILAELDRARLNHDTQKKEQLEKRLNELDNVVPISAYPDGSVLSSGPLNIEAGDDLDYNYSMMANIPHRNHAIATVPAGTLAGTIYVAVGQYASSPNSDTVKVYSSTNGGVSWVWQYSWWMPGLNMDCRSNEMDITIAYAGTTAWLLGVTSIDNITANNTRTIFWRRNLITHEFYYITLFWPGTPTPSLDFNGRLASDDAIYGTDAYVYITVSHDSLESGFPPIHRFRQKFARILTPFASTPSILYPTAATWPVNPTMSANNYMYNDVAYVHPGQSRIFRLAAHTNGINGSHEIVLFFSNDLGNTISGWAYLPETTAIRGPSLASVVANNIPYMIIVTRKFVSGSNWNLVYHYNSTGGTTLASWQHGVIENSSYKSSGYPNVTWVRGTTNNFKAAFALDSGGITRPYYTGWNGSAWNSPSRMPVGNLQADTVSSPAAGYRLGGGDNCLTIWSSSNPIYASYLCGTTVGINGSNNPVPQTYSLSQNYPNPFNPVTSIKYDLPKPGFVKLTVYDMTGKEVEVLVNEEKEPGKYEITWDGSKYSSGVYFYNIETGDFKETKKMVLIK